MAVPEGYILCCVQAAGQNCILVTRGEESGQCNIILCDAIGTPVDSNTTSVEPVCLTMTSTHVVVASADTVFVWLYNPTSGMRLHVQRHSIRTVAGVYTCLRPLHHLGRQDTCREPNNSLLTAPAV